MKNKGCEKQVMGRSSSQAILFELLRSYTVLARTLNLSKAVRELGSTRQTVRRHIKLLEEQKGMPLFRLEERQYYLTDAGKSCLKEAEDLLERSEAWLENRSGQGDDLHSIACEEKDGGPPYYLQQHSLAHLWQKGTPLLQYGFKCWANAKGKTENIEESGIHPYLMFFRQLDDRWICVETGRKSAYSNWFGWRKGRSTVGCDVMDLLEVAVSEAHLVQPFKEVKNSGSVRLDHIFTKVLDEENGTMVPVSYQRLLMGCRFPDGNFALAILVDPTLDIEIPGLDPEIAKSMPEKYARNIPDIEMQSWTSN